MTLQVTGRLLYIFYVGVLVACMAASIESGVPGKVYPGKVDAASASDIDKHLVACH